jgi:hypothetical protein
LRAESQVAAKAAVDLVVVLVVDVDVDEKPANAGSQVLLTVRTLANNLVHVHVRWNVLKAARLKARGFEPRPIIRVYDYARINPAIVQSEHPDKLVDRHLTAVIGFYQ